MDVADLIVVLGTFGKNGSHNSLFFPSHIRSSNRVRFETDHGNFCKLEQWFILSLLKFRKSPIFSGKLLMLLQSDISRKVKLESLPIESGSPSKLLQDLSLSSLRFSKFPISSGSAHNLGQCDIVSFSRGLISQISAGSSTKSSQKSTLIYVRLGDKSEI